MKLTAKTGLQIQKPISEVFEAFVNPEHLTKYFISYSSGTLESGTKVHWEFEDFPGTFPVTNIKLNSPESVSFVWDVQTVVTITLTEQSDNSTVVKITEGEKECNEKNLNWLIENTSGWTNFLDCLKAYLEYGIRLRKGAFNYLKPQK